MARLIVAVVHNLDAEHVVATLRDEGHRVTVIPSLGGFCHFRLTTAYPAGLAYDVGTTLHEVYAAKPRRRVKLIPMSRPFGKYNVYNKITLSPGTSH